MKELTRAEEQVMLILWRLNRGLVHDVLADMPDPKPAYTTVSTILRILVQKGFVAHRAYGKTHEYYPLVTQDAYRAFSLKNLLTGYFGGSFQNLVSFFGRHHNLDVRELDELLKQLKTDLTNDDPPGE